MATQVAPPARRPFAVLNESRIQSLASLKNRQNAVATSSKRKASSFDQDNDNSENIDPIFFTSPKKSKALDTSANIMSKPTKFTLTDAPPSPNEEPSVLKPSPAVAPAKGRAILNPRGLLNRFVPKTLPSIPAPAGRSPTRKRTGISGRRRSSDISNGFARVNPPTLFGAKSTTSLPFSIDAALKGTIPGYGRRNTITTSTLRRSSFGIHQHTAQESDMSLPIPILHQATPKASWYFDIHEDTPEEENTNLMYHSTETLDISSDEESSNRTQDLNDKENVPPSDDLSQTSFRISSYQQENESAGTALKNRILSKEKDVDACDVDRSPLGDLRAEDFYPEGFDANSCFVVFDDDIYEEVSVSDAGSAGVGAMATGLTKSRSLPTCSLSSSFNFSSKTPQPKVGNLADLNNGKGKSKEAVVHELMRIDEDGGATALPAKVLEPIEKVEEDWKIWESGSACGE